MKGAAVHVVCSSIPRRMPGGRCLGVAISVGAFGPSCRPERTTSKMILEADRRQVRGGGWVVGTVAAIGIRSGYGSRTGQRVTGSVYRSSLTRVHFCDALMSDPVMMSNGQKDPP